MYESFGPETNHWLNERSRKYYDRVFVNTGFAAVMEETLLLTEDEYNKSGAMKDIGGSTWWIYIAGRFDAARKMGHQFTKRFAILVAFAPMALLLLIPCFWDGLMARKIKQLSFKYSSVLLSNQAQTLAKVGFGLIFVTLLIPIAIPPLLTPLILVILTPIIAMVLVANAPKML